MTTIINEGLDYHDMERQLVPTVSVDEYSANMGKDSDIVTLAFTAKGKDVGEDLSDWFEGGYDYVLDAQVSDGEVSPGKYLVFVELARRSTVPERIIELLSDLKTLTDLKVDEWTIIVDGEEYKPEEEILKQVIICSPGKYREIEGDGEEEDEGLNEMRELSGLEPVKDLPEQDAEIKAFKSMAGL